MADEKGKIVKFPELKIEKERENGQEPPKKRRSPLKTVITVIVAVFIVCCVSAAIILSTDESSGFFYRVTSYLAVDKNDDGLGQVYEYQSGAENVYACLKNALVLASRTDVKLYNRNGDTVFSRQVELKTPAAASAGGIAVVYDRGGTSLFAFTGVKDVLEYTAGGEILGVTVSESGHFAVTWRESGFKTAVTVFDKKGAVAYTCGYTSGYVTAASVSPNGRKLAVAVVSQEDGTVTSRIDLYSMDSSGAENSVKVGGELAVAIGWPGKSTLCCVCESRLVFLNTALETLGEYSYGGMYLKDYSFGISGRAILLFNQYKGGGKCTLAAVDATGAELGRRNTEGEVLSMDARGKKVAYIEDLVLTMTDGSLGSPQQLGELSGYKRVLIRADLSAILISASRADLYVGNTTAQGGKK